MVKNTGNVGIGTTNPGTKLEVEGGDLQIEKFGSPKLYIWSRGNGTQKYSIRATNNDDSAGGRKFIVRNEDQSTDVITITSGGNVGIGMTNPDAQLEVRVSTSGAEDKIFELVANDGRALSILQPDNTNNDDPFTFATNNAYLFRVDNTDAFTIASGGNVGIGTTSPNYLLDVRGSIGNNTTLHHSDIRWKKNVQSLPNSLDMVTRLRGVNFEWRRDEFADMNFPAGKRIGLIAQEVEEVIPEVVSTTDDGYKSVAYANLVAVLIEAVKEQQKIIDEHNSKFAVIEAKIAKVEKSPSERGKYIHPVEHGVPESMGVDYENARTDK